MFNDFLTTVLDAVQSLDPLLRTILTGLFVMLETSLLIGLIVPGDSVMLLSATAVNSPATFVGLVSAALVGGVLGESIGFAIGRWLGPKLRRSKLGAKLGEERWQQAETYIERRGGLAVFLSRFIPVLHSVVPVVAGMSTMRYRTFIAWTIPACLLWATGYTAFGSAAAASFRELSSQLRNAWLIFVGIVVVGAVLLWLLKKLLFRAERRYMVSHPDHKPRVKDPSASTRTGPDAHSSSTVTIAAAAPTELRNSDPE